MFDVAVVGSGPVGQLLALQLGQAGHSVALVERWPNLFQMPRAVHYDHEIARLFQSVGVGNQMRDISTVETYATFKSASNEVLRHTVFNKLGISGWPEANGFAQPELESVLEAALNQTPTVRQLRGWEAASITQSATEVAVGLRSGGSGSAGGWTADGGQQTITSRYVVGADGANSTVRQNMATEMVDLGFRYDWLVVNVKWKPGRALEFGLVQVLDPKRPTTLVAGGPNRRRWEFMLMPGETAETMNREAVAWRLLEPYGVTPDNAILERNAVYTFQARWADHWRDGRLLLAGDAAHLMPPFLAQGMCSGMRDAASLSWRLDMLLRGKAQDSLLDSYETERLPHVQHLIHGSVGFGRLICVTDPEAAAQRNQELLAEMRDPSRNVTRPPAPRLGPGIVMDENKYAGMLSFQSIVESGGRKGMFDDVAGRGFVIISTKFEPSAYLNAANRTWFERELGGIIVNLTPDGEIKDIENAYADNFSAHGFNTCLVRPDFYLFGAVSDPQQLNPMVENLRRKLGEHA